MDASFDESWVTLAQKLWLTGTSVRKVNPEIIKTDIWDQLDAEHFPARSLTTLESLQILEKFLWPSFTPDASNHHILLIAVFVGVKQSSHLPVWDTLVKRPDEFSILFRRILSLSIDTTLPTTSKLHLLNFVINAFQSLERGILRKECAPLVSIATWNNLHADATRERLLDKSGTLRKAWRASQKRYDVGDEVVQARIRFERSWLYSMLVDFSRRINDHHAVDAAGVSYCERFLEFVVDLTSQLPTRRYTNTLLKDFNLLPIIKFSKLFGEEKNLLFRDLYILAQHFVDFAIDDHAGQQSSQQVNYDVHCKALAELQRIAMKHFEPKLKVLALSNYASIDQRIELESLFSTLSDSELEHLCELLNFRTTYPKQANVVSDRQMLMETLVSAYERRRDFQDTIACLSVLPTETSLYDPALLRNETYDGSQPLAIPKLNLQYLSLGDFLWRSFLLQRSEAFYEIRKDMESTVKRMRPRPGQQRDTVMFDGFSKMALPVARPAIIEVAQPKVGTNTPAFVRAEVLLDISRLNDGIRSEWDSLRPGDVVFLLAIKAGGAPSQSLTNGHTKPESRKEWDIAHLRAAEVVHMLDENSRTLRESKFARTNGAPSRARQRRLLVNLDSTIYKTDIDRTAKGKSDIYQDINVIVRRNGRENNFRPVLETMQQLIQSETQLPSWLQEVFLGYGDPTAATYTEMQEKILSLDFRDTFLNWEHLNESFAGKTILSTIPGIEPPYILEPFAEETVSDLTNSRKRRRDHAEPSQQPGSTIKASTYKPSNTGPYPTDAPKSNTVRFTPTQVEGILSGTQRGLSLIVGPPGTGKTDVATQIINLLYHNFPHERILLVAHSNQALNQLFQKIIALDIDVRHLLRLGHGEEELESEASYSKAGRVESFLENRQTFLAEVDRLAACIGAQGAHGSSCETADYFNKVYIQPAWSHYWDTVRVPSATPETIIESFPFHDFFSTAPIQPLFPAEASSQALIDIAAGCESHVSKIFTELEVIRPFELLRHPRDQANHLLVNEARIIAMTSTHAAIRRSEIANLGFHYDTLIMEEAAQITEIESFIPCAMQKPDSRTGELPLKRMVLIGDHFQNSPVIKNMAFRQYANFEQSLFLRLVRLGVPTINLDQQGRCRPSIAKLFKWRYPALGNLPSLMRGMEFSRANAGFKYDYQFVDVPDYQGQGEREPSPHFIQNLGEAEYAVALYQYMRLLGYPSRSISILATYAGQKALIRDVLEHRCKGNRLFGLPRIVTTVDKYQGEQNDYVILSLTRTRGIGYLRDVRRLTVALSRARLGLYILGRRELFETCYELKPAMDVLLQRPDKLVLNTGEMFPCERGLDDTVDGVEMDGVEHLGQYVFEMTQAKVKALGGKVAFTEGTDDATEGYGVDDEDRDEVDEEDPLHEGVTQNV